MTSYRQYCPIARSSEILAERWTPLIVRNLLWGATTFTEIARGVPAMSRSMLIKRLRKLERVGVIATRPKRDGNGSTYHLTPAGRDLAAVTDAMATWASKWLDVTDEHTDPGFALWAWVEFHLVSEAVPNERTLVEFEFPEEAPGDRYFWLLAELGEAEVCYTDPGGEVHATVIAESEAFVRWHIGQRSWDSLLRSGSIEVKGSRGLVRSLPTWHADAPDFTKSRRGRSHAERANTDQPAPTDSSRTRFDVR